jgi:hypothetical protein
LIEVIVVTGGDVVSAPGVGVEVEVEITQLWRSHLKGSLQSQPLIIARPIRPHVVRILPATIVRGPGDGGLKVS